MSNEDGSAPPAGRARVERFEDLVAWQKARELVKSVFEISEAAPIAQRFSFRDQIQRAAVSVMSNIAEGFERGGRAEFHQLLSVSKASCAEVRSLLYVAYDAGYIDQSKFNELQSQATEVARIVGGLRAAVAQQRDAQRRSS